VPIKVKSEIRYFLSSCRDDPAILGRAIRTHWAIENALHWVLNVTFREDGSRVRDQRAARNFAVLQDRGQPCRSWSLSQGQRACQAHERIVSPAVV
jgi:predicted transposase YbfD/YdcC